MVEISPKTKKWLWGIGGGGFVAFYIIHNPENAADIVNGIARFLAFAAQQLTKFVNGIGDN